MKQWHKSRICERPVSNDGKALGRTYIINNEVL